MSLTNGAWHLAARPAGPPQESDFEWRESPATGPGEGQVLVRVIWLSIDPTNRVWMNDADSYLPKLELGDVMRGIAIGRVEESRYPGLAPGDAVQGLLGWQRFAVVNGASVNKLPSLPLPLSAHFGLLGHIGLTAYFGLTDIGKPRTGETLVVSAAAGAVGSLAVQIGKILGLRVAGIAGGPEKCRRVVEELGADACVDYKGENLREALRRTCPQGIDIDFENVGGRVMDAVLERINLRARIVLCGMISQYNATHPEGPRHFENVLIRRARVEGFIVTDYLPRAGEGIRQLLEWHQAGRLQYRLDVTDGLERAPQALKKLFDGANDGKVVVRVSDE